ncbi:MAG: SsrA-binding protein [Candidatus Berkelbacteria bacterium Licking1014_2]|uniref:SsrA-binding protein n=1 Tax=Candidatus Berkelbacteria bacterium Licking1014_2 TaxID=2017146 RepID=A0A554LW54_9BACT|nr:MAG: SsrA-binding protein [Candidatus Berkelbacteria bacterium Licking1014_2]
MGFIFFNKKAKFDYTILEEVEAGLALTGREIKLVRAGKVNLTGSYVKVLTNQKSQTEVFWLGGRIGDNEDSDRTRKLLLNKTEIKRLTGKTQEKGLTLLPLKLYDKRGRAKLLIGLGRGKKQFEKREEIKKRDLERDLKNSKI